MNNTTLHYAQTHNQQSIAVSLVAPPSSPVAALRLECQRSVAVTATSIYVSPLVVFERSCFVSKYRAQRSHLYHNNATANVAMRSYTALKVRSCLSLHPPPLVSPIPPSIIAYFLFIRPSFLSLPIAVSTSVSHILIW